MRISAAFLLPLYSSEVVKYTWKMLDDTAHTGIYNHIFKHESSEASPPAELGERGPHDARPWAFTWDCAEHIQQKLRSCSEKTEQRIPLDQQPLTDKPDL